MPAYTACRPHAHISVVLIPGTFTHAAEYRNVRNPAGCINGEATEMMKRWTITAVAALLMIAGCDGNSDPFQIEQIQLRGQYELTELSFDPQGVLPLVELKDRVGTNLPRLVLARNLRAQLIVTDTSGLTSLANGAYASTHPDSVRLDFGSNPSIYGRILMSQSMRFFRSEGSASLKFSGTPPDGLSRQRLLDLVPEFQGEQLLDPVPGVLTITFTRIGGGEPAE